MKSKIKPLYDSDSYEEFVKYKKSKGLQKKFYKDLPQMWKSEIKFRAEFEKLFEELF